ncbi:MAG: hypothetical protein HY832_00825 [Candidatus Aenigmarchaeota archaeon]|nr:hypothetical protein [Candidatus Aenigmarchaeota archaeon]
MRNASVGTDPFRFYGAVFDSRYIYFAPLQNSAGSYYGEVLRYDTRPVVQSGNPDLALNSIVVQSHGNKNKKVSLTFVVKNSGGTIINLNQASLYVNFGDGKSETYLLGNSTLSPQEITQLTRSHEYKRPGKYMINVVVFYPPDVNMENNFLKKKIIV